MATAENSDSQNIEDSKSPSDKEGLGSNSNSGASDEEILRVARKRFKLAVEAENANRKEALEDLKFMVGEQWPLEVKNSREQDSRPCLTINRIPQFVRQVTNDQRQNRPSIKVNPFDSEADVDTAKILQGCIRHIEYNSHADIAIDTAFESTVSTGLGYFRLVTEYSDPMSFQQEIKIKRIRDRFAVYLDPFYQEPDGSDTEWGFVFDDIPKDEFKAQYKNSELSGMNDWESLGGMSELWVQEASVRVAEYYYKDYENAEIVLLSNKQAIRKDQLPKKLPDGIKIVSERTTILPVVKWCKINGIEILERTVIPGPWIPIIPVVGEEQIVEGKKIQSGIIRHAKDPQRMYNYWASSETETIALAPRAPFIGVEGQFEGYEDQWKTANVKNHAFLQYKAKTIGGAPVPPPQRQVYEPPVQAITNARMQSSEDLKATTGIYDATLGNRSNEVSGVAIQRRTSQAQTSNFHFIDNLSRSLRHTGRIILDWIPQVYDTPQALRIIGEDGAVDIVKVNQIFQDNGEDKSHFLSVGRYDVAVDTGPSFATKRQEAVASMIDLTRVAPGAMQSAMDLLVRNMDWPMAQEIADRIKKTLPPNITADDKDKQMQVPPQVQQQMAQMGNVIQQLSQELNECSDIIKSKRLEIESKERIALVQAETQLKLELLRHDATDARFAFDKEMEQLDRRLDILKINQPIAPEYGGNAGPQGPAPSANQQQQPTGGPSPGQPMGV